MSNNVTVQRKNGVQLINEGPSRSALEASAEIIRPNGLLYKGSAVVHIYETLGGDQSEFVSMTHKIKGLPESQVDAAFKELKRALMVVCGRKVE